jgi:serine/tyrosine/threonine adenylyltransferase
MTPPSTASTLQSLNFDNRFTRELPGDENSVNSRRQVLSACYSRVTPKQVPAPRLVAFSREVAALLDLAEHDCSTEEFAQVFAGNRLLPGMDPFAMCYGGHQFGNWAGQLGDGRAINLGEVVNTKGQHWTLQLKGAGPTPYSRTADGLAVLRSSVREFLCSEAMYHLGVPTTRALSLVLTGDQVVRDMFYDGNPRPEPGAIVCRVAPSFTRFGNFQIFSARRDHATLKTLVDFTIRSDFPHLGTPSTDVYARWFTEICERTAEMIVHWMRVGFVHGVMNTDNMSILGLTIDYGPYGWIDNYDLNWTPNTTDAGTRRYRFGQQPQVALWNLLQLANALLPLFPDSSALESSLGHYAETFHRRQHTMMAEKLGLSEFRPESDEPLISELSEILQSAETDMTIFFRNLANLRSNSPNQQAGEPADAVQSPLPAGLINAWYSPQNVSADQWDRINSWVAKYRARLHIDQTPNVLRKARMDAVNPKFVLRNYMAQQAIDLAETGDLSLIDELLELLRYPYEEQPGKEHFAEKRPHWARQKAGCSMLSCSS